MAGYSTTLNAAVFQYFLLFISDTVIALAPTGFTKRCPTNQFEVDIASTRLNCGKDKYGNNQYMCLPNKEKSSLIEFCFTGVLGAEEKGYCLEFFEGKIVHHSCLLFKYGCPDKEYYDTEFFKYPACQTIDTKANCYVLDASCERKVKTEEKSASNDSTIFPYILLGGVVFVLGVAGLCVIGWCIWKRLNRGETGSAIFLQDRNGNPVVVLNRSRSRSVTESSLSAVLITCQDSTVTPNHQEENTPNDQLIPVFRQANTAQKSN